MIKKEVLNVSDKEMTRMALNSRESLRLGVRSYVLVVNG